MANGRNQYTSVAGATHTHDLNGNLTGDGSRTFGYDAENRLTSVSGSASLTLTYDPLGRLRQTTAGAATTDFLYEGDRLLAEYNGATVLRRYAHGPGVDEPIVWYEGSGLTAKRWLHPDERGSIVAFSDGAGAATVYRYGEPRRVSRRLITDGVIDTRSWRYATEFPGATARRVVTRQRQGVRSRRRSARAPRYFASFLAAFQGPKLMVRIFVTTK
ncbi:MAG TPA: hypothetical protein VFS23_10705 [Vicinamibacterales bacterium]|nr:hypothetical protein [Vicinamibacterales bacterium]